jgi:DNA-binding transcriptional MerR regulator
VTPKLYKAGEVCEATGLQPYVLRSWEKEFPGIGVQKSADTPRLYRQSDLDHVLRIKQLVFGEGLTLAGARRRLDESAPASPAAREAETAEALDVLGADARQRIAVVRNGLQSILSLLSQSPGEGELFELTPHRAGSGERASVRRAGPSASATASARLASGPAKGARRDGPSGPSAAKRRVVVSKSSNSKRRRAGA